MNNKAEISKVVVYQAKNGAIELRGDFSHENIWATQAQIADIFGSERSVITKHIRNILKDKELDEKSVCAKFAHTGDDGKTYNVQFYNLDIILSVGYRTNSKLAIGFRKWATKTLRSYIVDGFAINKERIAKNYTHFLSVVEDVKKFLPSGTSVDPKDAIELITLFADTWLSLDAYDKGTLSKGKLTRKKVVLSAKNMTSSLAELKTQLVNKSEATDILVSKETVEPWLE
jgi:Virulence protein RhuM family